MNALLSGLAMMGLFVLALRGWRLVREPVIDANDYLQFVDERQDQEKRAGTRLLTFLDRVIGGRVLGQIGTRSRSKARLAIAKAGAQEEYTVDSLIQRQSSWATLGALAGFFLLLNGTTVGFLLPVIGWFVPRLGLWLNGRKRIAEIERELPDFLDVLAVVISAGLGFRSALRRVATMTSGPVAEEMLSVLRQIDLGATRRRAFEELRERTSSESMNAFITAFLQAEELGTPISGFLDDYAKELRRTAGQRARTAAAQANPKISLILTLVIMPAISLFMVGSIVLLALLDTPA